MSSIDLTRQILTALPLDLGKPWGEIATQWQIDDARAVLDPDHPQRLHWLGRPKGASKSTDIAAILIVWLLTQARPGEEGVVAAADEDQANRLLDRARGFVHRSRALKGRITVQRRAILGPDGARVTALSADAPSTEGILTPFAIIEELPNWPETDNAKAMWTAIFSSVPKDPRMRLVVIGHAGAPEHWSYRILERARQSKRWRVNEIPGPLEWISEDDLEEQRHQLREAAFNRRHLNIWTHAEDRLVDPAALRDAVTLDGPLVPVAGVRYVLGVDLGFRHDRSVVSICHSEPVEDRPPARRVVLDRMIVFEGTRADEVRLRDVEQGRLHPKWAALRRHPR
jgi:phage terminase large subunit-like protein